MLQVVTLVLAPQFVRFLHLGQVCPHNNGLAVVRNVRIPTNKAQIKDSHALQHGLSQVLEVAIDIIDQLLVLIHLSHYIFLQLTQTKKYYSKFTYLDAALQIAAGAWAFWRVCQH
jgi:hypothetical protein